METKNIEKFAAENNGELISVLKELCAIPAPSHHEENRAQYCKKLLHSYGLTDTYIDDALNVVCPMGNCKGDNLTVFLAHTDTVFPDTQPFAPREENGILYCPGASDDTASVAVLMMCAKYFADKAKESEKGALFVLNSCEEGLGNLKGTKQLMKDFEGRIGMLYSFDGVFKKIASRCVGSVRYNIEVLTEGGHSFLSFGNKNAIYYLSCILNDLYSVTLPKDGDSKTTYNVGIISGGTSVNTIAQNAEMMYEYRSDSSYCLEEMGKFFNSVIEKYKKTGITVNVTTLGVRPCMKNVDISKIDEMVALSKEIIERRTGVTCAEGKSSTDCNIPLSMGIPALCIGVCDGDKLHTREEFVSISNLYKGVEIGIELIGKYL